MAPPAKRRKRNVVDESDGEEDDLPLTSKKNHNSLHNYLLSSPNSKPPSAAALDSVPPSASPSPVRKNTRSTLANQSPTSNAASGLLAVRSRRGSKAPTKSPSTSPEKSKSRVQKKGKPEEKGKTADLLTLFSKQAQRAQTISPKKPETTTYEDFISDPISEDDDVGLHKTAASSLVGKNAQRRFKDGPQSAPSSAADTGQRFLKPQQPQAVTGAASVVDDDQRPWSERFAPANLGELAVHKKKVADVRSWLEDVIRGRRRQRLLILKGAAGTGKTTTVQLLARDMHCEVLEWRNPTGSNGATQGYASAAAQFEEFMGRGSRFGQLDTDSDTPLTSSALTASSQEDRQKLILIEEFPNTFMRSSTALTSFKSTILQYLAANTPPLAMFAQQSPQEPITPLVMIISETLLTTSSASSDSFTAHRLLGPEIMRHPSTFVIEFNAIAPTLMAKALEVIVQKESRKSGRRRTPGPLVLQRLGEIGDIRSAISSLEFLCVKGDDEADWGAKVTFSKQKKGSKDGVALTKGERDTLELISQRESTLGIFHAVGKVVYNKRDELPFPSGSVETLAETLPDYLAEQSRPKRSQVCVDTLIDETGTDTHTFIYALHENFALSCERTGPSDPNSSLHYINGGIEYLSESDLLCPSWDIFFGGRGFSSSFYGRDTGSHILRQDEMAFQLAVRGLLFSLPSPVKRQTAHGGRGGDAFKMFYPTSLKLWRAKEELEALIDLWAAKLLKGEGMAPNLPPPSASGFAALTSQTVRATNNTPSFRRPNGSGSSTTSNKTLSNTTSQPANQQAQARPDGTARAHPAASPAPTPLLALGSAARTEMLLERLPYMAHMARAAPRRGSTAFGMTLRDIDRVVSFQGIGAPGAEEDEVVDDEDDGAGTGGAEAWATDRPVEEGNSPRKKRTRPGAILSGGRKARAGRKVDAGGDGDEELLGASALSGPVMKLVLSDDDIEDD